jgi:alpha-L-rhamnosidase
MKSLIYALLFLLLISCSSEKNEFKAVDLRCEYLENPLGIDTPKPRLFWKMEKPGRGVHQSAYQIQAASSAELLAKDSADLWDSGVVESGKSIQIVHAGNPLKFLVYLTNAVCYAEIKIHIESFSGSYRTVFFMCWNEHLSLCPG